MRKMMTKEVTSTEVKMAKMEMKDGEIVAVQLPTKTLLGNITLEKAQRLMSKEIPGVTVVEVIHTTEVYEMPVEEFIKLASVKE